MRAPIHSFELQSPADLLAKAKRELGRLVAAYIPFEEDDYPSDHGFNFAITAWHIADWVWKFYNPNNTKNMQPLGIHEFNEFHSLIRSESEALAICYEIATGSKHMKLTKESGYIPRVQDTRTSQGPVTALSTPFKVLKVELANGELKRAEEVFQEAVEYWEASFAKHQIA